MLAQLGQSVGRTARRALAARLRSLLVARPVLRRPGSSGGEPGHFCG